jgi:hypothetical protein
MMNIMRFFITGDARRGAKVLKCFRWNCRRSASKIEAQGGHELERG